MKNVYIDKLDGIDNTIMHIIDQLKRSLWM